MTLRLEGEKAATRCSWNRVLPLRMNVQIKLFAGLAEQAGKTSVEVELGDRPTVADLRTALQRILPEGTALDEVLVAVNRRYANDQTTLNEGDEVALIPPVSGGSPEPEQLPFCLVTQAPLDIAAAYQQLVDPRCGGTVLFSGTVREWTRGRKSLYLDYEAYHEMAIVQMQQIARDVEAEWPGVRTLQWHRVGRLFPTDIAVICAAASPHREAAFAAAKTLIDRLKKEVPIWKRETYDDGETTWQATP
ncbi:molybdopterin converting factor subunit 1 [Alicyclobacillus cycloheptanicus]|uniref:Molybdopterin synthase catalytic subunit n=1 Tax=Alicyclobacillus cycloheptanicus TaxID=1457 RepID=A0ABT9XDM7_9BACL|nr:molybdopterin converting factor subunit 1 [Alicyclobacillus cycloheptanicus]MDQ0188408.1 molybdopterin synthase catalytic subunit [Alicyclobacillus cycloheptanicus]WDM01113.1 molybdopterin converting factor subunit 1 [Alicyclobacillus cycloheptanicus]